VNLIQFANLFPLDNRTGWCPVHNLHTGSIPASSASGSHFMNRTSGCPVLKFQKNENQMASSGCPTRNFKNQPKSKILPPRHFLPLSNTTQWLESLPYRSITLETFINGTIKDVFWEKTRRLLHCSSSLVVGGGEEEW